MAVAIGIWVVLLGYGVAWAGWRNLGISWSPQTDGSVTPSTQPYSLLDAFTCRTPSSATTNPAPGPSAPASSPPSTPAPSPNPTPAPNLRTGGIYAPIAVPRPLPTPPPGFPSPPGLPHPGGVPGILSSIVAGAESVLHPFLAGLRL